MTPRRQQEFAELIANHQSQIYGFVRAMVRCTEDAQDLHQQTLTVLWQKFDQFESGTNFLGWALRVAELEVRSFRRKRQPLTGLQDDVFSQLANVMHAEAESGALDQRKAALQNCLAKLGDDDRELLAHVYVEQQQIRRVAEQLGRLPQSISNSLRRIRLSLYKCIERSVSAEGRGHERFGL
jgi:RNA polymerase sigma-70 factor (ECF subfamily)